MKVNSPGHGFCGEGRDPSEEAVEGATQEQVTLLRVGYVGFLKGI